MRASAPSAAVTVAVAALVVGGPAAPSAAARAGDGSPRAVFKIEDDRITESSGLAASRKHKGVYWTHNDSDDGPYVYAVDSRGRTVATVTLRGVEPRDVEAIAVGPGGRIYVGDIGDNDGVVWPEVWIYRFTEPDSLADTTVDVVRYTVRYEDGPRDAEALMVHPKTGRAYIASKEDSGAALYEGPETLSATEVNVFRRTAEVPWVTDGAFSPDGTRLVLRGYFWSNMYRWQGGAPAKLEKELNVPVQRQGESVTFTADGRSLMYGSEGPGSQVWELPLAGEQLPDSVPREASDETAAAENSDPVQGNRNITVGFVVFAVALAGALGLRRMIKK